MSFAAYRDLIEENDTVIIYISFNTMYHVTVTPRKQGKNGEMVENVLQTNYGALKVKDLIGKRFGTKVRFSRGYGYALHPTPELWTKCLPHRTQILYSTDISLVTTQGRIKQIHFGYSSIMYSTFRSILELACFNHEQKRLEMKVRIPNLM